jgi:uncharacterized protein YqgV (UPF0045/DUF77 family)
MGTGETSVSTLPIQRGFNLQRVIQVAEYIAECQRVLEKSGLTFKVSTAYVQTGLL